MANNPNFSVSAICLSKKDCLFPQLQLFNDLTIKREHSQFLTKSSQQQKTVGQNEYFD